MKIYGILAYPAEHSLSPIIHTAGFKALNFEAEYRRFSVEPENLAEFMKQVRTEGIAGFSVSMPHKQAVMKFLDEIDEAAQEIGAVNTVVNQNGQLKGYNFDGEGARRALKEAGLVLENQTAVVLGAGGAARAIVYALKKAGAKVVVLNRTQEKAEQLGAEFGVESGELAELGDLEPNILVNATAVGMAGEGTGPAVSTAAVRSTAAASSVATETAAAAPAAAPAAEKSLVPVDFLQKHGEKLTVFDMVYKPLKTRLVRDAKAAGCKVITGEKMLLYQGLKQFELWTEEKAPEKAPEEAMKESLRAWFGK